MIPTDKLLASDEVAFLRRVQHAFDALEAGPVKTLVAAALVKRMFATLSPDLQKKLLATLKREAGKKSK